MNYDRTFGLEIEIAGKIDDDRRRRHIAAKLNAGGINAVTARYGASTDKSNWKVSWDSSCGLEIISPPLRGYTGLVDVSAVCQILVEDGATVNEDCGLHVHHDASDATAMRVTRTHAFYAVHQDAISHGLEDSRKQNRYCEPLIHSEWENVRSQQLAAHIARQTDYAVYTAKNGDGLTQAGHTIQSLGGRYQALNWRALAKHGTVEFRQHQGTLDAHAINYWIWLTQMIVEHGFSRRINVRAPKPRRRRDTARERWNRLKKATQTQWRESASYAAAVEYYRPDAG